MRNFFKVLLIICLTSCTIQNVSAETHFLSDVKDLVWEFFAFKPMSWEALQAAGGIKIGKVKQSGDEVFLPVMCDVSGLSEITCPPKTLNSALGIKKTEAKIMSDKIFILVYTQTITEKNNNLCKPVDLKHVRAGKYKVYYYDGKSYFLGDITIN